MVLIGATLENNWFLKTANKTMRRMRYERGGNGNKSDSRYEITNANKIYCEIQQRKYVANPEY